MWSRLRDEQDLGCPVPSDTMFLSRISRICGDLSCVYIEEGLREVLFLVSLHPRVLKAKQPMLEYYFQSPSVHTPTPVLVSLPQLKWEKVKI